MGHRLIDIFLFELRVSQRVQGVSDPRLIVGVPVACNRCFVQCDCLVEVTEKDLAFQVMRSHFHHGYPKGAHCCVQCTLAVIPVFDAGAIRYFDCRELSIAARRLVRLRQWRFARQVDARMVRWALGDDAV